MAKIPPALPAVLTLIINVAGHRRKYAGNESINTDHIAQRSVMAWSFSAPEIIAAPVLDEAIDAESASPVTAGMLCFSRNGRKYLISLSGRFRRIIIVPSISPTSISIVSFISPLISPAIVAILIDSRVCRLGPRRRMLLVRGLESPHNLLV